MKITQIRKAAFACLDALPRTENLTAVRHALQDDIDACELPYFVVTVDPSAVEEDEDQYVGSQAKQYMAVIELTYVMKTSIDEVTMQDQIDVMIEYASNAIKNNTAVQLLLTEQLKKSASLTQTQYEGQIVSGARDLYIKFEE